LIKEIPVSDEKKQHRILLRNGFIPGELSEKFEKMVDAQLKAQKMNSRFPSWTSVLLIPGLPCTRKK